VNFLSGKKDGGGKRERGGRAGRQASILKVRLGLVAIETEIKRHRER
jgi:hypothetical protein